MEKVLNVGLVGVGRFGRLHLKVLEQSPRCRVTALADVNEALLEEVGDTHGIERRFTDAAALLALDDIDAVDIVSDEDTHGRFVAEALRNGKHVFVEKPLATRLEEAEAIGELKRRSNLVVQVGNISRFSQPYVTLKRMVDEGRLGEVYMIRTKRHFSRFWFEYFGKRVHPVYESGVHDIDLILWFAGGKKCTQVTAIERNVSGYTYPDMFSAMLRFEDGTIATMASAWMLPDGTPQNLVETLELDGTIDTEIELVCERGIGRFRMTHDGLSVYTNDGTWLPEISLWPSEHDGVGGAIRAELFHFIDRALAGKDSPVAPLEDSIEAIRIADAVVLSAKEGGAIVEPGRR